MPHPNRGKFAGRWFRKLLPYAALLLGLTAYLGYARAHNRTLAPPRERCTLAEFARQMSPPARVAILSNDAGKECVVWIGSKLAACVPSGPPCYLFDESCRLEEWALETGEGGRLDDWAGRAWHTEPAKLEEVLQRCAKPGVPE